LVVLYLNSGGSKPPPSPPDRPVLHVHPRTGKFRTIGDALRSENARQGRVTIVLDEGEYREAIDLRDRTDLVIEAEPGKKVVIRPPLGFAETRPLLELQNTTDVHLKDLALDGEGRLAILVAITFANPGLSLEDLRLEGFTGSGVDILNGMGREKKPILLKRLTTSPPDPKAPKPAVLLRLKDKVDPKVNPTINDHIHIDDCKFEGDYYVAPAIQCDAWLFAWLLSVKGPSMPAIQFDPKHLGLDVKQNGKPLRAGP
jgi:hypothetical protein